MEKNSIRKVDVFLVGARKSGTTSLANFLAGHNEISFSSDKEPNYFNNPDRDKIKNYHSLFDWNCKIQIEASTGYTADLSSTKETCSAIKKYNPNAKIIYLIRNPLDRIQSHYRMSYERGDLNTTLNESLLSHNLLLDCTKYYSQIINYIEAFERENILILNMSHLNNPTLEKSLIAFLKLGTPFDKSIEKNNAADTDYRMPRSLDKILNTKIYSLLKSLVPKPIVTYIKSKLYLKRNSKMNMELNEISKALLKKELIPEIVNLQKIISFDISSWKDKLNSL